MRVKFFYKKAIPNYADGYHDHGDNKKCEGYQIPVEPRIKFMAPL